MIKKSGNKNLRKSAVAEQVGSGMRCIDYKGKLKQLDGSWPNSGDKAGEESDFKLRA